MMFTKLCVSTQISCRSKLVSVASTKCDVEYDRNCTMAMKHVEYVAGYRTGECKQIIKEKCYRKKIGRNVSHEEAF